MSASLVASGVGAAHGSRTLFSGVDFVIAPGDVIGLVGVNGAGKSTLLRILAGERPADEGTVRLNPPDATVGYLPQERVGPRRRDGRRSSSPAAPASPPRSRDGRRGARRSADGVAGRR